MKLEIKGGKTSKLIRVFIPDSSSITGAGLTGLVFNSASLVAYYIREGDASPTAITLATMTVGTWATGGFKEVSSANMPGIYEIGIPNAVIAAGVESVAIMLKGATNMSQTPIEIQLVAYDPHDTVRLGLTALPNAAAEASGGLYTRGSGAGQLNQNANGQLDSRTVAMSAAVITAAAVATDAIDADALATDAVTEIANGVLDQTITLTAGTISAPYTPRKIFLWLLKIIKFRRTQTATTETVYEDDGTTAAATSAKSDNGTTFDKAEYS